MTEESEREVWGYVAHRDGKFAGVISGTYDTPGMPATPAQKAKWKKEIAEFCGDFIADGFEITKVYSREEYKALVEPMPIWMRPKTRPAAPVTVGDLFQEQEGAGPQS